MGLFDFAKKVMGFGLGEKLLGGGAPGGPRLPKFPEFDPSADYRRALTAAEHQRQVRRSAYSLSDFILLGGKPGMYQGNLGA